MATTVKERLIQFIEYKRISKNAFEKACGLSTRYVSNMRQSIQPDKVKNIALVYPELNTGWLLTGEGSMLKDQSNQPSVQPEIPAEENPSADSTLIAELRSQIEKLEAKVDNLNQELGEKNALIKMMSQGGSGIVQVADGSLSANVG